MVEQYDACGGTREMESFKPSVLLGSGSSRYVRQGRSGVLQRLMPSLGGLAGRLEAGCCRRSIGGRRPVASTIP
jgi:hypothetical protein